MGCTLQDYEGGRVDVVRKVAAEAIRRCRFANKEPAISEYVAWPTDLALEPPGARKVSQSESIFNQRRTDTEFNVWLRVSIGAGINERNVTCFRLC